MAVITVHDPALLAISLPPLPRHLLHKHDSRLEILLEMPPPPYTLQPLPLHPRPFMEPLHLEISLHAIPATQRFQAPESLSHIHPPSGVDLHRASQSRTQLQWWALVDFRGRGAEAGGGVVDGLQHGAYGFVGELGIGGPALRGSAGPAGGEGVEDVVKGRFGAVWVGCGIFVG